MNHAIVCGDNFEKLQGEIYCGVEGVFRKAKRHSEIGVKGGVCEYFLGTIGLNDRGVYSS